MSKLGVSIYPNLITFHFVIYIEFYVFQVKSLFPLVNYVSGHPCYYFYKQMVVPTSTSITSLIMLPVVLLEGEDVIVINL